MDDKLSRITYVYSETVNSYFNMVARGRIQEIKCCVNSDAQVKE